jgi:hypothetical protein
VAGPRSDLWSLGATLFAAVEGTSPFARTTAIATLAALAADPVPPAKKAGPLRPVIEGLLRKDPAQRISAEDADRLLRRAAGQRRGGRSFLDGVRRQRPLPAPVPAPRPAVEDAPPRPAAKPETARGSAPAPVPVPVPVAAAPPAEAEAPAAPVEAGTPVTESPAPAAGAPSIEDANAPSTAPEAPEVDEAPSVEPDGAPSPTPEPARADAETPLGEAKVDTLPPVIAGSVASRPVKVAPPPARRKLSPTRGRGPLVAAAIALALVVLVMSVLLIALRDDDDPGGNQAAPAPSATVPPTGAPATSAPESTAGAGEPTGEPTGEPPEPTVAPPSNPTGPGTTKRPVPTSWTVHRGFSGFRVPVPPGMTASRDGRTRVRFEGGGRLLIIDQRDDPQPNPVADWESQESIRVARGDWPGYRKIKIVEVDYFRKAADWEWTYDGNSSRMHVLNRGFITGPKQAHSIYWSTSESRWAASLSDLQVILDNFVPNPE